ncbi:hypothetical protein GGF43_001903 [Coemansia sp. RSA 2618]|nr:hypothetical protein GGF43_001903 [Coemansia sp. RSA 2618]
MDSDKEAGVPLTDVNTVVPEDNPTETAINTQSTKPVSALSSSNETNSTTPKQLYGMLCWLVINGNSQKWRESPAQACQTAIEQCPHLEGAQAEHLKQKMDDIARRREQLIAEYGKPENVPRETRVFDGGPLFVIVDHAISGRVTQVPADEIQALLRIHGMGKCGNSSSSTGPVRRAHSSPRVAQYSTENRRCASEHPLAQRARQLTQAEVSQMRSEMAIRRGIALRDAKVLADWIAMKRRELELREMKIREFIRAQEDGTIDSLVKFEEYLKRIQDDL